jgi:hypothetical protein
MRCAFRTGNGGGGFARFARSSRRELLSSRAWRPSFLWIVAIALIVIGVVGTVVPAVPGVILVFAGMALGAWIDDFARIPCGSSSSSAC